MALGTVVYGMDKGFSWTGATTSTVGPFPLMGGKYAFVGEAAGTSQVLNIKAPSGNFTPVYSATTGAVYQVIDLPSGVYEVVIVSASGVSGFVGFISTNTA